jgi:Flp pilus assembly protein TadD
LIERNPAKKSEFDNYLRQAQADVEKTLALDPKHSRALTLMGEIVEHSGDYEKAESLYQQARKSDPNNSTPVNNIGLLLLKNALEIKKDPATAKLADFKMLLAEKHFLEALRINPNDSEAHTNLGALYQKTGKPNLAIEHFKAAVSINPTNADAYSHIGIIYYHGGNFNEVHKNFVEAVKYKPEDPIYQGNLNAAKMKLGLQ